jgi:predicted transcriptional regulator
MDLKTVKLELMQKILETNEENILEQVKMIFEQSGQDWWDLVDDDEKAAINEGLDQLNSGQTIAHKEVMAKVKKKYNS